MIIQHRGIVLHGVHSDHGKRATLQAICGVHGLVSERQYFPLRHRGWRPRGTLQQVPFYAIWLELNGTRFMHWTQDWKSPKPDLAPYIDDVLLRPDGVIISTPLPRPKCGIQSLQGCMEYLVGYIFSQRLPSDTTPTTGTAPNGGHGVDQLGVIVDKHFRVQLRIHANKPTQTSLIGPFLTAFIAH